MVLTEIYMFLNTENDKSFSHYIICYSTSSDEWNVHSRMHKMFFKIKYTIRLANVYLFWVTSDKLLITLKLLIK